MSLRWKWPVLVSISYTYSYISHLTRKAFTLAILYFIFFYILYKLFFYFIFITADVNKLFLIIINSCPNFGTVTLLQACLSSNNIYMNVYHIDHIVCSIMYYFKQRLVLQTNCSINRKWQNFCHRCFNGKHIRKIEQPSLTVNHLLLYVYLVIIRILLPALYKFNLSFITKKLSIQ